MTMTVHGITLDTDAVRRFCRKWKVSELSVYGSVLRADFGPGSDIDFLVTFEHDAAWDLFDRFDMAEELEGIVGRPVDLLERATVAASRNRFRRREILSTAEPVIAAR